MKRLTFINRSYGFAQRTFAAMDQTSYLPNIETDLWRSPVTQNLIIDDLEEFKSDSLTRPCDTYLDLAIQRTFEKFSLANKVKMLHLNDVFKQELDIWARSPGLPWKDIGYRTKGDIKRDPEAIRHVRKFAHLVKAGHNIRFPDCLAYVRSHVCEKGEKKARAIWGYPATITFMEAVYALPLIKAYQEMHQESRPIAYGFETATGGMKKLIKRFRGKGKYFTGLDFKKFDKTVPAWLINIAFDILCLNIDFGNYQEHGVADSRRMIYMFYKIRDYFINTTIRTANGNRYRKYSGIASGSYFTQLIGSIINTILINWMSLHQFKSFPAECLTLGDDSFIASHQKWDIAWCDQFVIKIGMKLNIEKSDQSESLSNIKFLGYYINHGIPRKDTKDWLAALVLPEKPDNSFSDVQNRALGLYYANMCVDKDFAEVCKIIVEYQPFELKLTPNFERMLRHVGYSLADITTKLPDPLYFIRFM